MKTEEIQAMAVCCISAKPLKDSTVNVVMLPLRATWKFPQFGNVITGKYGQAAAFVHDDCIVNGKLTGEIKWAVEFQENRIIYHSVEELEPYEQKEA